MDKPTPTPRTAEQIEAWLVARIGELTDLRPDEIDRGEPFARFGLDSVTLVALTADLERWLGYRFRENPLPKYPTVTALAQFLAGEVGPAGGP